MGLDGPKREIVVEPVREPGKPRDVPAEPRPAPTPTPTPEKVPA